MEGDRIMNKKQVEAIIRYVDAAIEYELAKDDDEWHGSCVEERKAMEAAKEELLKA